MDIKRLVDKTLEDTIGFMQVHIRMLEALRDKETSKEKASGIQMAIDSWKKFCKSGEDVGEAYTGKRREILQKMMQNEAEDAVHPAIESCGKMDKSKN